MHRTISRKKCAVSVHHMLRNRLPNHYWRQWRWYKFASQSPLFMWIAHVIYTFLLCQADDYVVHSWWLCAKYNLSTVALVYFVIFSPSSPWFLVWQSCRCQKSSVFHQHEQLYWMRDCRVIGYTDWHGLMRIKCTYQLTWSHTYTRMHMQYVYTPNVHISQKSRMSDALFFVCLPLSSG